MPTPNPLTPMAAKFVTGVCRGLKPKEAAIEAGATPKQAAIVAKRYLATNPVKTAIDTYNAAAMEKLKESAIYNVAEACRELDQGIAFAMRTNNATAFARCVELKAKLHGLMEKDTGAEANGFQINIVGLTVPGTKVQAPTTPVPAVDIFQ